MAFVSLRDVIDYEENASSHGNCCRRRSYKRAIDEVKQAMLRKHSVENITPTEAKLNGAEEASSPVKHSCFIESVYNSENVPFHAQMNMESHVDFNFMDKINQVRDEAGPSRTKRVSTSSMDPKCLRLFSKESSSSSTDKLCKRFLSDKAAVESSDYELSFSNKQIIQNGNIFLFKAVHGHHSEDETVKTSGSRQSRRLSKSQAFDLSVFDTWEDYHRDRSTSQSSGSQNLMLNMSFNENSIEELNQNIEYSDIVRLTEGMLSEDYDRAIMSDDNGQSSQNQIRSHGCSCVDSSPSNLFRHRCERCSASRGASSSKKPHPLTHELQSDRFFGDFPVSDSSMNDPIAYVPSEQLVAFPIEQSQLTMGNMNTSGNSGDDAIVHQMREYLIDDVQYSESQQNIMGELLVEEPMSFYDQRALLPDQMMPLQDHLMPPHDQMMLLQNQQMSQSHEQMLRHNEMSLQSQQTSQQDHQMQLHDEALSLQDQRMSQRSQRAMRQGQRAARQGQRTSSQNRMARSQDQSMSLQDQGLHPDYVAQNYLEDQSNLQTMYEDFMMPEEYGNIAPQSTNYHFESSKMAKKQSSKPARGRSKVEETPPINEQGIRQCSQCPGHVRPQMCGGSKHRWRCVDKRCRKWYGWVKTDDIVPSDLGKKGRWRNTGLVIRAKKSGSNEFEDRLACDMIQNAPLNPELISLHDVPEPTRARRKYTRRKSMSLEALSPLVAKEERPVLSQLQNANSWWLDVQHKRRNLSPEDGFQASLKNAANSLQLLGDSLISAAGANINEDLSANDALDLLMDSFLSSMAPMFTITQYISGLDLPEKTVEKVWKKTTLNAPLC